MQEELTTEEAGQEVIEDLTQDQHGSGVSDEFSDAFDKVTAEVEESVSEDIDDEAEESAEAEIEEVDDSTEQESEETSEEVEGEAEEVAEPETEQVVEPVEQPVEEVVSEAIDFELDEDLVDPSVKKALDVLKDKLNEQQKAIDDDRSRLKAEQEKVFENRIDSCFDKYNNDLPDIGSTSKLSEKNGLYRRRLFQHAQVTAQMDGISIEEAIKDTVQMYKNKDGEKATEKKIITKLNKQKSKFSNPPTRKNKTIDSRKFANPEQRKRAVMDKAFADAGIN